jgi:hypothetical protein
MHALQQRKQPRYRAGSRAAIFSGADTFGCTVVDIAPGGARLKIEGDGPLEASFQLVLRMDEPILSCQLVWRRGAEIGVSFV